MEIAIIVVCTLFVAGLLAAVIVKAVTLAKRSRLYKQEIARIQDNDTYVLNIVQDDKTVRIECKDINSDNVELVSVEGKGV